MTQGREEVRAGRGARTRIILVASFVLVIAAVTAASLLMVRHRLREQIARRLSSDLLHSVETFAYIEAQQRQELQRESALLANLPTLKAVMTTSDERTISDLSVDFWKVSGNDLFALADRSGKVVALHTRGAPPGERFALDLAASLRVPDRRYLLSESRLFAYTVRPLLFGDEETGSLLGYVINGDAIDGRFVRRISHASDVEAAYLSHGRVVVSTLQALAEGAEVGVQRQPRTSLPVIRSMAISGERFLLTTQDASQGSSDPLQLLVLKSSDQAEREVSAIDHLVFIVGLLATAVGVVLMLLLSNAVTQPLEALAEGVRAFGRGDVAHRLPAGGTLEVRELSASFARMRDHIREANRALLESERLATIGRMAYSVSHDLRHYLSTIYANAEFLVSARLSPAERQEIFNDIDTAVHGTTDLLDSLLVFSPAEVAPRRSQELIATLLERTLGQVRVHPDANGVELVAIYGDPVDTAALVDVRQIERAMFNVLLNACQSRSTLGRTQHVRAVLEPALERIVLTVTDDGPGVPDSIRQSLFEPFVSEGKQKGTGLGLTLVQSIAVDHGGTAAMVSTRRGETIFRIEILRLSGSSRSTYVSKSVAHAVNPVRHD